MTRDGIEAPKGGKTREAGLDPKDESPVTRQRHAPKTSQVIDTPSDLVGEIARVIDPDAIDAEACAPGLRQAQQEARTKAQAILSLLPNGVSVREECAKVARYGRAELEPFVDQAAMDWCGEKDRETFHEDIVYFRSNWQALGGLRAYVVAAAIRAMPLSTLEGEGQ